MNNASSRSMRHLLWLLSLLAGVACSTPDTGAGDALAARVDSIADQFFEVQIELHPELATSFGLAGARHFGVTDNSLDGVRAAQQRMDSLFSLVSAIDPAPLAGRPSEVAYAVLREALESERALRVCRAELWGVASGPSNRN